MPEGGGGCTPLFGLDRYVALSKVWFLGNCGVFNRGCFCLEAFIKSVKATDERPACICCTNIFFQKKLVPLYWVEKLSYSTCKTKRIKVIKKLSRLFKQARKRNNSYLKQGEVLKASVAHFYYNFLAILPTPGLSYSALIRVSFPFFFFPFLSFPCHTCLFIITFFICGIGTSLRAD